MKRFFLSVCLIATIVGCGNDPTEQTPASKSGNEITIGVMPKLIGIDYFNACERGAKEAAEELGINLVYDGPIVDDVAKQSEMIDSWIIRKFDAICVAPNDKAAIARTLAKVKQRGIHALAWDADGDECEYYVNMAKNEKIARAMVDVMAEALNGEGDFAIITGRLTTSSQNAWIAMMREYIAKKYPKLNEIALKTSEENQELAFQVTGDLLKSSPDLKAIVAITSVSLPGAAQAVEEANAQDRVFVTGLSSPNSMRQYVKRGVVKKFVLWSPVDLGYLTVHTAYRVVKGLPIGSEFDAGRLGTVRVDGTEVILGDPMIFDKTNIHNFNF